VTIRKDWHPTDLQRIFLEFLHGQTMWQPIRKRISAHLTQHREDTKLSV
jgi:hypothetical protein